MESTNQATNQKYSSTPNEVQNVQLPQLNQQLQYPIDYNTQRILEDFLATRVTQAFPVGSIFFSVVSTNPSTLLGYGTWEAFATGKTIVGIDTGDIDFDTVEETGGIKSVSLSVAEMPQHHHANGGLVFVGGGGGSGLAAGGYYQQDTDDTGSGSPHTNLQPYIVTYIWKRIS